MFLSPKYADKHMDVIQNDWKGLVTIALMNGFQIACNNASLTVMELSMNQVRTRTHARLRQAASTLHPAPCPPCTLQRQPSPPPSPPPRVGDRIATPACITRNLTQPTTTSCASRDLTCDLMRQVIRASVPVCVALFAVCIEHK
eukprot:scaffold118751_cov45-Phaeocystis_antarctica.AAC.1